jgi:hypothetical protein
MRSIAFLIIIASLVALLVVGTEDMGREHTVFANRAGHVTFTNRGINVQTNTNQDQGCEAAGVMSGITTDICLILPHSGTNIPGKTGTMS